jgi:formate dehydrogenase major subunit
VSEASIAISINGVRVDVAPGTTILEAARQAGIRIPTLCHVRGLEPAASCFVCAVQIEGRRGLTPACAMPAADGMVVATDTQDVRNARQAALELLLSDHAGDCIAPCSAACPAGLDIPKFVFEIARRDTRRAMEVISERLALPGSLGRICPRLCEQQCRRHDCDEGLAIGALHRYAADRETRYVPSSAQSTGKSVAIIGAGPAGLAAAFFLLQKGHACMLFDAKPNAGGMLRYAIPPHRLPKDALDLEVDAVRNLGAEFRFGHRWRADFTLAELRSKYNAVFIAIGAQRSQTLGCEGEGEALPALNLLNGVACGSAPELGDDVVVIGGGNTAIDCSRSAVRLGVRRVRILYRRTKREMPCLLSEAEEAEREGVEFEFLTAPVRLQRGRLTCQRMELGEPDLSGRRRPVPVPGSEFDVSCSKVVAAIGQSVERELAEREGLRVTKWGIAADQKTLATNLPGVFAGGDAVLGADLAVRAVAMGRLAAASIDQYLRGKPVNGEPHWEGVHLRPMDDLERAAVFRGIEAAARVRGPEIEHVRRVSSFDEVELTLPDADAQREARRCLTCGCRKSDCCTVRSLAAEYNADPYRFAGARRRFAQDDSHSEVIYEPGKCILCDACVRIAARAGEEYGLAPIGRGFEVAVAGPFGKTMADALKKTAQECAAACPTGAIALRSARSCDLERCGAGPVTMIQLA